MDNLSPEQIQAMISMLQAMLPQTETVSKKKGDVIHSSPAKKTKKLLSSTSTRNKNKSVRTNKFVDMPEKAMHKEDVAIDKKLSVRPPVPRARSFKLVKVVCRVCGKREEVSPGLIHESIDRYKCNKCSTSSG
jgi:hypothetical protein